MKPENMALMLEIARKAGLHGKATISTQELASLTGYSQQSISRKLRDLANEKLIERTASNSGTSVILSEHGRRELNSLYLELKGLFTKHKAKLSGKVVDGLGEGKYYTQIPQYNSQFSELFGISLYPGTLNLIVDSDERAAFTTPSPIKVNGFSEKERTFGGIDCWPCLINGKSRAIAILPHRTNHPKNVLELVADYCIRDKFKLKNNSEISIELIQWK